MTCWRFDLWRVMKAEIEKKYLVAAKWRDMLTGGDTVEDVALLTQGYLSKVPTVRVRVNNSSRQAFLTIKGPRTGITCTEFEYEIPHADGLALISLCEGVIIKTRTVLVDCRNQRWEIDEFDQPNKGLIVAEIELDCEEQAVTLPSWVECDVSHDPRYLNVNLIHALE